MAKEKDFIQELTDKYGDIMARDYPDGHPVVSTGSLAIDVSTGIGGIPVGRYTEVYGAESGGKTTLAISICKNAIQQGIKCLYVDVENSLDLFYTRSILGDLYTKENIIVVQPNSAEDAFNLSEFGIDSGFRCIIFDSVAAIATEEEVDKEYGKQSIALGPRLTNQFLKKTRNKIKENEVAFVFTNQVRANIGSYMGGYTIPGGYALKHYTSLRIMLSKGKTIEVQGVDKGNDVSFIIKKNKLAVPFRQAETNIIYGEGIDFYRDVIKFATMLGVIQARGAYLIFEETTLGQGVVKALDYLHENQETLDNIIKKCYNMSGIKYPPVLARGKE